MVMSDDRRAVERAQVARAATAEVRSLLDAVADDADVKVVFSGPGGDLPVVLPRAAVELLGEVLDSLADGREPSVMPVARELSTGEVAGLLGVSRDRKSVV